MIGRTIVSSGLRGAAALVAAMAMATAFAGCSSTPSVKEGETGLHSEGTRNEKFTASTVIYNASPQPNVQEKKFNGVLTVNVRSGIRSYRFKNHFGKKGDPDVTVVMALSGHTAGMGIYDKTGRTLAEYPKGRTIGPTVVFETRTEKGYMRIRWFLGEETVVSSIQSFSNDNTLGYSEVTFYRIR